MSRPLRIDRAGGWYHLTGRGNERRAVFRDDRDREHFCELLGFAGGRQEERLRNYREYVGQRACGLRLGELAAAAGMSDYKAVSMAIRRYEGRLRRSPSRQTLLRKVCQLSKVEM